MSRSTWKDYHFQKRGLWHRQERHFLYIVKGLLSEKNVQAVCLSYGHYFLRREMSRIRHQLLSHDSRLLMLLICELRTSFRSRLLLLEQHPGQPSSKPLVRRSDHRIYGLRSRPPMRSAAKESLAFANSPAATVSSALTSNVMAAFKTARWKWSSRSKRSLSVS